jgi:type I restriction enzyme S subunit
MTLSEFGLAQSKLWPKKTVCITIAANIAETAILAIDACFPDSVAGFIPDKNRAVADYVEFFLRTAKGDLAAFAPATAQKNINLDILGTLRIPMPPMDEQHEIIRRIETAFTWLGKISLERAQAARLLDHLDQALLSRAFRGDLVPQDPADESATIPLERIKAERLLAPESESPRLKRAVRSTQTPREKSSMTKSRFDPDVKGKPYLATLIKSEGASVDPAELFRKSDLPVADFYKQLAWEVDQGHLRASGDTLEAANAA